MRRIEYVRLINIQDTTPKSNFDIYQMILIDIPQKLAEPILCVQDIRILVPSEILL